MKKIAIIPAYNESGSIKRTIEDLTQNAPEFDYVIVNDCSTDGLKDLCRENNWNVINLPVNLGIGGAVQTGYQYAREKEYEIAVQFDGDGQHSAAYLNAMAWIIEHDEADMVIGSRFINKEGFQSTRIRKMGIRYFTILIRFLTGKTVTDPTSGMRMINRELIEFFSYQYPKDYPEPESVTEILHRGKRVKEIPVVMKERQAGVSSISLVNSIYYMIKVSLAVMIACLKK